MDDVGGREEEADGEGGHVDDGFGELEDAARIFGEGELADDVQEAGVGFEAATGVKQLGSR